MSPSIASSARCAQAGRLAQRIQEHKEEAAQLRAGLDDPQQALFRFIRERFEAAALVPDEPAEMDESARLWEDTDELNAW